VELLLERAAGLDVHRDTVMACARFPRDTGRGRATETRESGTMTAELRHLAEWLGERGVTDVAMEATGVYWKACVRHEALFDREGIKGPLLWAVAAA
jgi:transposase